MISIIIPAYNEETTIGLIVRSVLAHPNVTEVIVIDDGSSDNTGVVAQREGARIIRMSQNMGKADAMDAGVKVAQSNIVLFLDADVVGFTPEKISMIIDPVLDGKLEMHVGILSRPFLSFFSKKVFYILPVLSGIRALTKILWYRVPRAQRKGFKIELALNHAARTWGKGTGYEIIHGLTHTTKEKKHGFWPGLWRRAKMITELASISFELYVRGFLKNIPVKD